MTSVQWRPIGAIAPHDLGAARLQAHNVVQWLARMSHSYLSPEPDDSHMSLCWQDDRRAVVTRDIRPGLALELRFPSLVMQFIEDGRPAPHEINVEERSPAQVEAWVLVELLHRGLDRDRFSKVLPYEISGLMTGDAVDYSPRSCAAGLEQLSAWLGNAAKVLDDVGREAVGASRLQVECWPHGLHLTVPIPGANGAHDEERPLRVGFAPGDAENPEPCFYVTREPVWTSGKRPQGAVLTAPEILASATPAVTVARFLREAISAARRKSMS